eukprot:COSAG01_NODE_65954_length_271_cov_1.703488_1_plen_43_part_01
MEALCLTCGLCVRARLRRQPLGGDREAHAGQDGLIGQEPMVTL